MDEINSNDGVLLSEYSMCWNHCVVKLQIIIMEDTSHGMDMVIIGILV